MVLFECHRDIRAELHDSRRVIIPSSVDLVSPSDMLIAARGSIDQWSLRPSILPIRVLKLVKWSNSVAEMIIGVGVATTPRLLLAFCFLQLSFPNSIEGIVEGANGPVGLP